MRTSLYLGLGLVAAAAACGRSDLIPEAELFPTDGGDDGSPNVDADAGSTDDVSLFVDVATTYDAGSGEDARINGCSRATCPQGCCTVYGTCAPGTDTSACGFGGEACTVCAPGDFCKGGCISPPTRCGPDNCVGCCASDLYCADGVHDTVCGHGGERCALCGPEGMCEPLASGGGACTSKCDPQTCTGCCYGNVCAVGTQQVACGTGGVACVACPNGQACENGACR